MVIRFWSHTRCGICNKIVLRKRTIMYDGKTTQFPMCFECIKSIVMNCKDVAEVPTRYFNTRTRKFYRLSEM